MVLQKGHQNAYLMLGKKPTHRRMRFLDSLRGLAALVVVFHHFMVFNSGKLEQSLSAKAMRILHFISDLNVEAVLFFFVLSGFSIGLSQRGKLLRHRVAIKRYLYKRFRRIMPIYLMALALAAFVGFLAQALFKESYSFSNLVGNLLFLQTPAGATDFWFSPYGQNGPLWSLAFEMFFYLFFPLFSMLLLKIRVPKLAVYLFLLLTSVACIAFNKYLVFIPPLAFLSFFLVWWAGFQIAGEYLQRRANFLIWITVFVVCTSLLTVSQLVPSTALLEILKTLLIASVLYFLLFLDLSWVSAFKWRAKKLVNSILGPVGDGSYALYALHYPIFILMQYFEVDWIHQIIFIFALIICCVFLERWISKKRFKLSTIGSS
ncbi:acyltransferase family protein [Pelobium manganitolerans]|nr:acyltransferase [Pelobium manganitolerans]